VNIEIVINITLSFVSKAVNPLIIFSSAFRADESVENSCPREVKVHEHVNVFKPSLKRVSGICISFVG
jgi:hypothetical protein